MVAARTSGTARGGKSESLPRAAGSPEPLRRQRAHLGVEIGLSLKADAGQIRHDDVTVFDPHAVGKSAIGLEQVGIAFIAAKAQSRRDIQRHLVSAVRSEEHTS